MPDFSTISFSRKSNALNFATNKGTKEKGYCIILSVPEPLSGKNFNTNSISNSVEPHKDFLYEIEPHSCIET